MSLGTTGVTEDWRFLEKGGGVMLRTLLCAIFFAAGTFLQDAAAGREVDWLRVRKHSEPSIVLVKSTNREARDELSGTGVVILRSGSIITALHNITKQARPVFIELRQQRLIWVTIDGKRDPVPGELTDIDPDNDLAIVKLVGVSEIPALCFADGNLIELEREVFRMGYPDDGTRLTTGLGRVISKHAERGRWEVSADMNHGDSGGAMLDSNSELVGVSVAGIKGQNRRYLIVPEPRTRKLRRDAYGTEESTACRPLPQQLDWLLAAWVVAGLAALDFILRMSQIATGSTRLLESLRTYSWKARYFARISAFLKWTDARFGSSWPWSTGSFDWCVRVAFLYPVASVMLMWIATGANVSAMPTVLPTTTELGLRLLVLVVIALSTALLVGAQRLDGLSGAMLATLGLSAAAVVAYLVNDLFVSLSIVAITVAGSVICHGFLAGVGETTGPAGTAIKTGGIVTTLIAILGAGFVAVSVTVLVTVFASAQENKVWHGAIAFGVMVACCAAVALLEESMGKRHKIGWFLVVYWLLLIAATGIGVAQAAKYLRVRDDLLLASALIVFWAAVPLLKVLFDWCSLGLTRWLLSLTVAVQNALVSIVIGVFDLAATIAVTIGLAISMAFGLEVLNGISVANGGEPLLALSSMLAAMRANPWEAGHWWVYATLLSTFIPCIFNLIVATISWTTVPFAASLHCRLEMILKDRMRIQHPIVVALVLTLRDFLGIALAGVVLVAAAAGVLYVLPEVGNALLRAAEQSVDLARTLFAR